MERIKSVYFIWLLLFKQNAKNAIILISNRQKCVVSPLLEKLN